MKGYTMPILECKDLTKCYVKGLPVLDRFNLSLPAGRILGILGPNGCGKSTLLKLIAGLLIPDSGDIRVDSLPVGEKSKAIVSYLPERTYISPSMKVGAAVGFFKEFYEDFDSSRAASLLEAMKIPLSARFATLSKGTKEKVQLVLVMSRRARLYLLDEPLGGVDPVARDQVLTAIISSHGPDSSVVITTHLVHDVENYLDDFIMMGSGGRILFGGDARETMAQRNMRLEWIYREVFR
ncbi:MAG: ABC transporter ATP-binding protein [Clostridia bacterium]|nr:ABC transporter ATP-binding protein [Clostridia bacterium]